MAFWVLPTEHWSLRVWCKVDRFMKYMLKVSAMSLFSNTNLKWRPTCKNIFFHNQIILVTITPFVGFLCKYWKVFFFFGEIRKKNTQKKQCVVISSVHFVQRCIMPWMNREVKTLICKRRTSCRSSKTWVIKTFELTICWTF